MFDELHRRGPTLNGFRLEDLAERAAPHCEILDGTLVVSPLVGTAHQVLVARLLAVLGEEAPPQLTVLPGVTLARRAGGDRVLTPDVAVVRTAALTGGPPWLDPDDVVLAAEVACPSTRVVDLVLKRELYAGWGIGCYWVVDPVLREVRRFESVPTEGYWLDEVDLEVWPDA